jgi:hypothetical protein
MDAAREARDVPWLLPPRQAWSMSFQRDPPAALDLAEGRGWGARLLGELLGRASWDDARVATVAAGLLTYAALGLPPVGGPLLVAGAALLGPASVVGIPFGASDALLLCGLLAATRLARRGNARLSALVVAFAVVALPRGLEAWPGAAAPGLGLPNLFCYWGAERAPFAATLAWLLPWAALGTAVLVGRRLGADLGAALGAVGVVTLASGISAQEIATPLALLTHAALRGEDPSRT